MKIGPRLSSIERRLPTIESDERRIRAEVFEVFKNALERLTVVDRALLRDRSRHQRALGESPDAYDEVWRDALGRHLGFHFTRGASGEMERTPYSAPPWDLFLERIALKSKAWSTLHLGEECGLCSRGRRS